MVGGMISSGAERRTAPPAIRQPASERDGENRYHRNVTEQGHETIVAVPTVGDNSGSFRTQPLPQSPWPAALQQVLESAERPA